MHAERSFFGAYAQVEWAPFSALRLEGGIRLSVTSNLTDRRDPVAESELGDAQYYRPAPRRVDGHLTCWFWRPGSPTRAQKPAAMVLALMMGRLWAPRS